MRYLIAFLLLFASATTTAQDNYLKYTKPIVDEGIRLYKSEMASWYGTDLFLENYKDRSNIGGYFSYIDGDSARCIFFSRKEDAGVIGTISFDSTYMPSHVSLVIAERPFTKKEQALYTIRQRALKEIIEDTALFKRYSNTNFNPIPLNDEFGKRVYVLTGPQIDGVAIFGNDFLLKFDDNGELIKKKALHKNIILVEYGEDKPKEDVMHTHLPETAHFITATDICTTMLYARYAGWKHHSVISEKYLNVWSCSTNTLYVVTAKTLKKMSKDKNKKQKAK